MIRRIFCVTLAFFLVEIFEDGIIKGDETSSSQAVAILRQLEASRLSTRPFLLKGKVTSPEVGSFWNCDLVIESEGEKYRITPSRPQGAVVVFDGKKLHCYDGRGQTTSISPSERTAQFVIFDPRSIGISTGLYSDLTLHENLAFHSAKDIELRPMSDQSGRGSVSIELTDRFSQRIRFEMDDRPPFRVFKYVKSIFDDNNKGKLIFQYVAESTFDDVAADNWIPSKVKMYTSFMKDVETRDDLNLVILELEKPDFSVQFNPDIWTKKGLSPRETIQK
ncbi:LolA family protein [Planctomicrobium sp. SH527]|uniref:LolA family protein n=1 Tax=Planctomicrobium sp. SH527 TaxID=3448123 RepID=UPI003F5C0262